ncbi:MAG: DNA primase [Anaerolineae bacterium]|nr:DNA primase [Anaerolineae bacterium]
MSVETLLSRLDRVKKTGRAEWTACCPAHDSKSRQSLSISETTDGRILIHDFGGCSASEVLAAVGLDFADLFPERDHDDVGRRAGWRSANHKDNRQAPAHISARTALVAIAHDATEACVLVSDAADGKVMLDSVRLRLFELAGRIADALRIAGVA